MGERVVGEGWGKMQGYKGVKRKGKRETVLPETRRDEND